MLDEINLHKGEFRKLEKSFKLTSTMESSAFILEIALFAVNHYINLIDASK